MAYTNDAQTLADVLGPASAAGAMATQNAQAQQEAELQNQLKAGTLQADIQKPFLQNLYQQQQTAAETGVAAQQLAAGKTAQAAQPSAQAATISGNQLKMTQDQAAKLGTLSQIVGNVAGQLDAVAPPARAARMREILTNNNIDPSQFPPEILSGDPNILRQVATKAALASQSFIQGSALETQKGNVELGVAGTQAGAHVKASEVLAGGRQNVAEINAQLRRDIAPPSALLQKLQSKVAAGTATPDERAMADYMQKNANWAKSAAFPSAITGTNTLGTAPGLPATGQGGAPTQPNPQALQTAAKQIWPNDDPTKYDYRVGPDGNLQRKAK